MAKLVKGLLYKYWDLSSVTSNLVEKDGMCLEMREGSLGLMWCPEI